MIAREKFLSFFTFVVAVFLSYNTGYCEVEWQKKDEVTNRINDALMGEEIKDISVDQNNNLWVLSYTSFDKKTHLSVNGIKVWTSAGSDLRSISATSVKDWTIELSSEKAGVRLTSRDGTIWGRTDSDGLWKFEKGADGTYGWVSTGIGGVKFVSSGIDGETWILCEAGWGKSWQVKRFTGSGWENKDGADINRIAVYNRDNIWMYTNWSYCWRWNWGRNNWDRIMFASALNHLSVGAPGTVWNAIGVGWTYRWDGNDWIGMGGNNVRIIAPGNGRTYAMNSALFPVTAVKGVLQPGPLDVIYEVYVTYN